MTLEFRYFANGNFGTIGNIIILLISIAIVFCLKNSFLKNKQLKFDFLNEWQTAFFISTSIILLNNVSEFLYFNF